VTAYGHSVAPVAGSSGSETMRELMDCEAL
jgi:hypothetical protein